MKLLTLFLFLILLAGSEFAQSQDFYNRVLSDLSCRDCNFIAINVKSPSFTGKVVVENDSLYRYLTKVAGVSKAEYPTFVLNVLRSNGDLTMKDAKPDRESSYLVGKGLARFEFRIVETSQAYETIASQGCVPLLRYYFSPSLEKHADNHTGDCRGIIKKNGRDLFFRPSFDISEQNNVIARLFELEIPVYLDDISGSLTIGHHTVK